MCEHLYYTPVHYLLAVEYAQYLPNAVLRETTHTGSRACKNKECVQVLKSCVCVLASLPEGSEQEYSKISKMIVNVIYENEMNTLKY